MHTPKCCNCGRFTPWDSDQGTTYGGYYDFEPPDPDYFCKQCAKEFLNNAINRNYVINCWWMKPDWHRMAHSIIKHRMKGESQ